MAMNNEAYDLDLFRPREPRLVAMEKNPKAIQKKKKHAKRQAALNVVVYIVLAAIVLFAVGYFITGNVKLTEMNSQIADCQAQLNVLQSERVRLESELAAKTSPGQVELYAQQNGMVPAQGSQIYYIPAETQDLVTVKNTSWGWLSFLFD